MRTRAIGRGHRCHVYRTNIASRTIAYTLTPAGRAVVAELRAARA